MKNIQSKKDYKPQQKVAFFVKDGMDSFLNDIINGLSEEYIVKKIIVNSYKQIDKGMEWADICWFEWCDDLMEYGSTNKSAVKNKIICRLHSYEAFDINLNKVNWSNIDRIIFVSKNIKDIVTDMYNIESNKSICIPTGIDTTKYKFKNRKNGFNIAYVGYINYKKGPMLLLHTFKAIYDKDSRYKLYIAGEFQDYRYYLYFKQTIKELGMEKNVIYEGWQDDLDKWLENKDYILCTSLLESQNISVMQAMLKGIKPIVHNFAGAKTIYKEKYIWNTIDEAVGMVIDKNYDSKEYSEFIINDYSKEKQINSIQVLLKSIINGNKNDFNYKEYWNSRLNNKFDIEGVGYIGLGTIYNKFLYEARFELLDYIIKKLFVDINNINVLELGPGIGMFTEYFYKNDINNYIGIDISEKSKQELSEKYKKFNFVLGDISEELYYPNYKVDLIFAADVLLHLTDEERYKNLMKILSNSLKDNGFIIIFDPITTINSKSQSPHLVIRDIKYIKEVLYENNLELIEMMPSTFFMNYPFDNKILGDKSASGENIFNLIQGIFSSSEVSSMTKEKLGEWLSLLDKECLINNEFGLSQKVMIIKKKSNEAIKNFRITDIWDLDKIKTRSTNIRNELIKNNEIKKYNLLDLFNENIEQIIDLGGKFNN